LPEVSDARVANGGTPSGGKAKLAFMMALPGCR
jgi:hypothetical protein